MSSNDELEPLAAPLAGSAGWYAGGAVPPAIPVGFRPAPSDDELETNILERWQGYGLVFTVFMALFIPAYFVFFEPARATDAALKQRKTSITRGEHIFAKAEEGGHSFQADCAACHGARAEGGVVEDYRNPANPQAEPVDYPAPNLTEVFKRQIVDQKKSVREAYQFVYETISKGRPGTPMPTWGLGYGGPMNDQQIEDVINYLISIQQGLPEGTQLAVAEGRGPFSRLIAFSATR